MAVDLAVENALEVKRLIGPAKQCLQSILSASGHPDLVRALSLLPLMTKNRILRREIVVTSEVISALICVLEGSMKNPSDNTLSLVVDSICHLLQLEEGTCGLSHFQHVLTPCTANTMAVQLTAKPGSDATSGLAILLKLLRADGNFILFVVKPINMRCVDPNKVLAALRMIVLLPAVQMNGVIFKFYQNLRC